MNPGAKLHRPGKEHEASDGLLDRVHDFCRVDLGLSKATAKEYRRKMRCRKDDINWEKG